MSAGKVVVYVCRNDSVIGPMIGGARVYPADGVPRGASRPFLAWQCQSNAIDRDLNGRISGFEASVLLDVVADTESDVQAILTRLPTAFSGLGGTTVNGVAVMDAESAETGDEINGPIDTDNGQAYSGSATISIYYGGS